MRALILVLSAVVVGLAASIFFADPAPRGRGPVFPIARLIADAARGEWATYRDEAGNTRIFRVENVVPSSADRPPRIRVRAELRDPQGQPYVDASHAWDHVPPRHGLFPLMAPTDPEGLDRLWVWRRIRRLPTELEGRTRDAWRVDLVDPALPPEGGGDHVVAWIDPGLPVFGLVRWTRQGRTWELAAWGPR